MESVVLSIRDFDSSPDNGSGCDRPRLRIPHFDLLAGKCHAVIGKSGAGKTILNSLILGLPASRIGKGVRLETMQWWDGRIRIRGADFISESQLQTRWRDVRHSGTLLYLPQLLPDGRGYQMSVRTYLGHILLALMRQTGESVLDVEDSLGSFPEDLKRIFGNSVTNLSGGERRRIELWARLTILKKLPKDRLALLVLDEPTTGLDVPDERRYLEKLREEMLGLPNLAVLVTTHALYFLDDHLPLEKGRPDTPLFDRVFLVHKKPESTLTDGKGKRSPSCFVSPATDSWRLCEAVRRRTPEKSVEDSMEDFVEKQAMLDDAEFAKEVEGIFSLGVS